MVTSYKPYILIYKLSSMGTQAKLRMIFEDLAPDHLTHLTHN